MEEFVRAAVDDDVDVLVSLEEEGRTALATVERGGTQWLATHACLGETGWRVRLADTGWCTLVAGVDGQPLAMATMRLPVGRPRPVAEIDAIYVTPEAREIGIGEQLLTGLTEHAAEAGAEAIEATALPGDRDTKNLFERFGMVARLIIVSRRLPT